jgi:hypothetical protein
MSRNPSNAYSSSFSSSGRKTSSPGSRVCHPPAAAHADFRDDPAVRLFRDSSSRDYAGVLEKVRVELQALIAA